MNTTEPAIAVDGLIKRFGDFTAVDTIHFRVNRGEIFGLLGPNGSGKTTTIRMMLGLLPPTAGTVQVLGQDMKRNTRKVRPHIGYMSQRFSLYNDLTVRQNLRFYGQAYGLTGETLEKRISEAVSMAGLTGREQSLTGELSGGWRQRLALNTALLHKPAVVFLDEPTAGVDPVSRRAFWDHLYHTVSAGVTVFVTTHYMDEAEHCQRLAFIQKGKIIAQGSPESIKQEMMTGEVLEIAPDDAAGAVRALREAKAADLLPLQEVELYGALVHVTTPSARENQGPIAEVLRSEGIDPGEMSVIDPALEDVFIACMK